MNPANTQAPAARSRYVMIGGFLGAGKTTAIGALARHLVTKGLRVGLITNDQAGGLVDTRLLRSQGFATEEIAGGCFCCRFNTLMEAAGKLTHSSAPDVFIAEPVGSCTDLVATVTYPLRRLYGDAFSIAPLSVLVDPVRAMRLFGLAPGGGFSSKVGYIFKKQLEEADIIVLSKSDLITPEQERALRDVLNRNFPRAKLQAVSVREGKGLEEWFQILGDTEHPAGKLMALDYDVYAAGEAMLGWMNATVDVEAAEEFDANAVILSIASGIRDRLRAAGAEIAHLKLTFSPEDALAGEIASVNCVRSDTRPEPGMVLDGPIRQGQIVVNLRAEADPPFLLQSLNAELTSLPTAFPGIHVRLEHEEHFRPGRPEPTHRDGQPSTGTGSACCTPEARARSIADGAPCC
ncbi:MAG: GTP-binding protein [Limisphaerales bacterium]